MNKTFKDSLIRMLNNRELYTLGALHWLSRLSVSNHPDSEPTKRAAIEALNIRLAEYGV